MPLKNIVIIRKCAHILAFLLFFSLLFSATASATITYDSGNNVITVTGYTEATPCTFTDIYNADQSGGWGKVSKQGANQFLLQCRLYVGDGSTLTYLTTIKEQIILETSGCGSTAYIFYVRNNAVFTSGILIDEPKRQGKHGSSIMVEITDTGDTSPFFVIESTGIVYLYATQIECVNTAGVAYWNTLWIGYFNSGCRIYQTIFTGCRSMKSCAGADVQNLLWVGNDYALEGSYFSTDSAYIWAFGGHNDIFIPPDENLGKPPITNFYAEKVSTYSASATYIGGLRNYLGPLPFPTIYWDGSPHAGSQVKWYADMDLEITDINGTDIVGATVTVKNKDGTVQFSTDTDANGKISETVFVVKDEWSGSGSGNTRTDYNDFTITIEKVGYTSYKDVFTLYKKADWVIALQTAGGGTTNTTYALIGTAIPLGARKTTMAAAFVLLSGMFMMMLAKRYEEDEQDVT